MRRPMALTDLGVGIYAAACCLAVLVSLECVGLVPIAGTIVLLCLPGLSGIQTMIEYTLRSPNTLNINGTIRASVNERTDLWTTSQPFRVA